MAYGDTNLGVPQIGYFTVIETDDLKVKVIDLADPDGAVCGYVVENNVLVPVNIVQTVTTTASFFLFLKLSDKTFTTKPLTPLPDTTGLVLIARVIYDAGTPPETPRISILNENVGVITESNAGDTYIGYCKMVKTADTTIKVVDGFSDNYTTETSAGLLQFNQFQFDVPAESFIITANAVIYIESTLVGDPATSATAVLKQAATLPTFVAGKAFTLVGRVKYLASDPGPPIIPASIVKFSQAHVPNHVYIIKEC